MESNFINLGIFLLIIASLLAILSREIRIELTARFNLRVKERMEQLEQQENKRKK